MKIFALISSFLLCSTMLIKAQTTAVAPTMPIDEETKKICYTQVVEVKGTMNELYKRAIEWFNKQYKNPQDVTKVRDEENGKIQGVHRIKVYDIDDKGAKTGGREITYTIYLDFKDNKYRYRITDLREIKTSTSPVEKWLDKKLPSYTPQYENYLAQIDKAIKEIIESLKQGMKPPVKKDNNW